VPEQKKISQAELVRKYFLARPNVDITHEESKKALEEEWLKLTGNRFEDSDRAIRKLKDEGFLIKVAKGIYRYDPNFAHTQELHDFDDKTKKLVLERDNFKCVVCGLGRENGAELHIDHKKPKSLGGLNTIENGQTLCSSHNFLKKNYSQLELGKRIFLRLQEELAHSEITPETNLKSFVEEILETYEKYQVDSHITLDDN
jgi:hypothetical protein